MKQGRVSVEKGRPSEKRKTDGRTIIPHHSLLVEPCDTPHRMLHHLYDQDLILWSVFLKVGTIYVLFIS
jgi:hypothetical protein